MLWEVVNKNFRKKIHRGFRNQKFGKSSGMGCRNIFWVKGKKQQGERTSWIRGLMYFYNYFFTPLPISVLLCRFLYFSTDFCTYLLISVLFWQFFSLSNFLSVSLWLFMYFTDYFSTSITISVLLSLFLYFYNYFCTSLTISVLLSLFLYFYNHFCTFLTISVLFDYLCNALTAVKVRKNWSSIQSLPGSRVSIQTCTYILYHNSNFMSLNVFPTNFSFIPRVDACGRDTAILK